MSVQEKILAHVREDENGCWIWTGYIASRGYAGIYHEGKSRRAHRVSYEAFIGPIPDGLTLDHLCRVLNCVNPAHLEPVTIKENTLRGFGPTARHARATHCPKGHPYAGENLYRDKRGYRWCRQCNREWRRVHAKVRVAGVPVAEGET